MTNGIYANIPFPFITHRKLFYKNVVAGVARPCAVDFSFIQIYIYISDRPLYISIDVNTLRQTTCLIASFKTNFGYMHIDKISREKNHIQHLQTKMTFKRLQKFVNLSLIYMIKVSIEYRMVYVNREKKNHQRESCCVYGTNSD